MATGAGASAGGTAGALLSADASCGKKSRMDSPCGGSRAGTPAPLDENDAAASEPNDVELPPPPWWDDMSSLEPREERLLKPLAEDVAPPP